MREGSADYRNYVQKTRNSSIPGTIRQLSLYRSTMEYSDFSEREVSVYEILNSNSHDMALHFAGSIALDVASREDVSEADRVTWLQRSHSSWSRLAKKVAHTNNISHFAIRSSMNLAALPAYQSIILGGELPSEKYREKTFDRLCMVGKIACDRMVQYQYTHEKHSAELTNLSGALGELAVILLHQRFTLSTQGECNQLALPSRLSEDEGNVYKTSDGLISRSWDVSVFQQDEESPAEILHKVQVKTRKYEEAKDQSYDWDISVINIKEDLAVGHKEISKQSLAPKNIVSEIFYEKAGDPRPGTSERLNRRSDLMLDILDG